MRSHTLTWTPSLGWSRPPESLPGDLALVLYFGPSHLVRADSPPVADLLRLAPAAVIAGCSTAGSILETGIHDDALVVVALSLSSATVAAHAVEIADAGQSLRCGAELALRLAAPDLRHVLVLSDGLRTDGAALAAGLRENLPADVSVTGGLAGDGLDFRSTAVGLGPSVGPGRIVAIALRGPSLRVACETAGGWTPFGPYRKVTRSDGPVLHSLDDEPALDLYRRYLGELAPALPASGLLFPLQIETAPPARLHLTRTLLAVDEQTRSVTFAGDIPEGRDVRLMRATRDTLIGSSGASVARLPAMPGSLTLAVSCVGRRSVLGQRAEEELETVRHSMHGHASVLAGFYSYGELAPASAATPCELHNQTLVLTRLSEDSP